MNRSDIKGLLGLIIVVSIIVAIIYFGYFSSTIEIIFMLIIGVPILIGIILFLYTLINSAIMDIRKEKKERGIVVLVGFLFFILGIVCQINPQIIIIVLGVLGYMYYLLSQKK